MLRYRPEASPRPNSPVFDSLMRSPSFTIAKNVIANVVRGGASAVVAIVLPHFLTRFLGHDRFAGWALMLQLAAYANYLDFGLQTAVARYFAGALERGDHKQRNQLLSTAFAILTAAGMIAMCALGLVAWQLPHIFRSVPLDLVAELRGGLLILGLISAVGLPLSAFTGVLIGMQRNEYPALTIATSRLLGGVAVVVAARHTQSLVWLALCVGGFNLIAALAQSVVAKKLLPDLRFSMAWVDRGMAVELIRYCSTLSVWSFGMLLVGGLDVTIVGLFNFEAVGAYSIAATIIAFFTGLNSSAFSAMLAPVAVLQARKEYSRISRLIMVTTRLSSYVSMAAIVAAFLFGDILVRAWVGPSYLALTLPILRILLIAQAVRLVGNAYGTVLVGMGLQRYGLIPVSVEGVANLLLSVAGMIVLGPAGVAAATFIAALIALTITISVVMHQVPEITLSRSLFVWQGIIVPFMPFLPFCIWMLCRSWYVRVVQTDGAYAILPTSVVILLTTVFVVRGISGARRLPA
jgi:O-antigen/teichoic acid export membrane protein